MNAVIGAGIIGLAFVASTLGYIQFCIWIAVVLCISIFTMDLVCGLSQWAGCYKAIHMTHDNMTHNKDTGLQMRNKTICPGECTRHKRIYSYEAIGNLLYGGVFSYFINCIILFYLIIAITTYFILIRKNLPRIARFVLEYNGIEHLVGDENEPWFLNGDYLLGIMVFTIHLPLGLLKRIDFLGFTSFIGMVCMSTFVFMVIKKQPEAAAQCGNITFLDESGLAEPYPLQECKALPFTFSTSTVYAIPMLLFSFMCHGNILSIVAELKAPTKKRCRQLIAGASLPCTVLYTLAALFGYFSYFNRTNALLLDTYSFWLRGDVMVLVSNIMVTICIMFSVPILHYPCRYSLWSLLHMIAPSVVPEAFDNGHPSTFNRKWFSLLAVVLHVGIYVLVVTSSNFKIVMALGGAISGSCIIQIFPAMYYLKIFNWSHDGLYNKLVWFILCLGCVTFIGNTGLVVLDTMGNSKFERDQAEILLEIAGRTSNFTSGLTNQNLTFTSTSISDPNDTF
jgi:amino acid permease